MSAVVVTSPAELAALVRAAVAAELDARGIAPPDEWVPLTKCGLPPTTVRRLLKAGTIRGRLVGRAKFVSRADLEKFMATDTRESVEPEVVLGAADAFEAARARGRARRSA